MLIVKFILVACVIFSCAGAAKNSKEHRTVGTFVPLLNRLLKFTKVHDNKHKPVFEALDGIPKIVKLLLAKNDTRKVVSESWPLDYIWFTDSPISRLAKYLLTAVIFKKILLFMMLGALMFFIPVVTTVTGDNANFHYFRHTDDAEEEEEMDGEEKDEEKKAASEIMYMTRYPVSDNNGLQSHPQYDVFNRYGEHF